MMAENGRTTRPDHGRRCEGQADLLAGFAEAVPVPVVLVTPDMRVRHANAAFLQTLGTETRHGQPEEFPHQWLMRPQDDLPRLQTLLHEAVDSANAPEPIPLSLRSADGTEVLALAHARLLPDRAESSGGVLAVTFDTTVRIADADSAAPNHTNSHTEQLRRSEERLKIIFEYAPDAYYLSDLKGNFVDGNRAAERIVGYRREELIGKSFLKLDLLPKSLRPKAARTLIKNRLGKPSGPDEFILNRKDGSQVTVEISTYPVKIQGQTLVLGIARDLTERQRARRELKESEARYRNLHEFSRDGCAATDLNGRIVESNTAFREMLGYSRDELRRLTYEDLTAPQWHATEAKIISDQVLKRGYSDLFEKELIRKDGTMVPVELRVYFRKDAEGKPAGMWAIVRDITERRRAEEQLRRSEERFKVMTDSAQDAIMMMDPEGRVTFYNKTAQKMFGWAADEAMGKDMHTLLAPKRYHEGYRNGFAHFQHTGRGAAIGKTLELTALRKDGTEFPIEISLAGVELDGQWHAIGIVRDITERKKARDELVREKTFSDSVINSMPGVFYMLDEDGKFTWWNKQFEEVTEYSGDEIPHLRPARLFEGDDVERIARAMEKVFRAGETTTEADFVSKSGRKRPYFFTGLKVERDGKPYLIGLGIDITERREAQVAMEKLNKDLHVAVNELKRSNQELTDFAHITAHDLKAPLRGIDTLAGWLSQDYGEQLDEQGQENLRLMQERVDRMVGLIDGILTYSKIGRKAESVEMLDTRAIVEGVVEQIAPPAHIEVRIEGELPRVLAERTRLMQVFQNLISNAIKYTDKPRGVIRISARARDDAWEFCVADNGPGIEAKHFDRIFQMFQTLSSSDRCNSTGLGLAVVKKIVELYDGRVWLESQMGQGSTFYFALPRAEKATASDSP